MISFKNNIMESLKKVIHSIITPIQAISILTVFTFYRGLILTLAPTRSSKTFQSESNISPINMEMIQRAGIDLLAIAIRVYCVVLNDFGHRLASAIHLATGIAILLHTLLNIETNKSVEPIDVGLLLILVAFLYIVIYMEEHLYTVMKIQSVMALFSGAMLFFFPIQVIKNTSASKNTDTLTHIYINTYGVALLLTGSYLASAAWGLDPQDSCGYLAILASVLKLIKVFLTEAIPKNVKDIDTKKRKKQMCIRSFIYFLLGVTILLK